MPEQTKIPRGFGQPIVLFVKKTRDISLPTRNYPDASAHATAAKIPIAIKPTISTPIAIIVISLSASAAPQPPIETSIAGRKAKGDKEVLSKPNVIVQSSKQASIKFGEFEYSMTPMLRAAVPI